MGFYVQERRFGFYQRQEDTGGVRATVRRLPAEDVPRFIEDADSEAEPDAEDLRRRTTLRRAEMGGQGRFLLARVAGEPASVVAFYEGKDRFVHHLATRVPFRRRGIASPLLKEVLAGARERGCRSTIISAAESGHPVGLYRSLGFTDEVYWRREYKHFPDTGRGAS
jgi:ribosomal protein S18 acetylase RimI-like enzyme